MRVPSCRCLSPLEGGVAPASPISTSSSSRGEGGVSGLGTAGGSAVDLRERRSEGGGRPREVGARKCRPPPRELPPLGCPRRCLPRGSPREIPPSCRLVARRTVPSAVPLCAQVKRECPQCSGARRAWSRSASYGLPIDRSGRAQGLCTRSAFFVSAVLRRTQDVGARSA